jgi:hypothetical protein
VKLITVIVTLPLAVFLALAWHEATEEYEPGGDQGAGWRVVAGWILLIVWLIFMAVIAALGALDDLDRRRIDAGLPTRAERGRHRRLYADQAITTHGTVRPSLPVQWVAQRAPIEVVLDEQPTGGER